MYTLYTVYTQCTGLCQPRSSLPRPQPLPLSGSRAQSSLSLNRVHTVPGNKRSRLQVTSNIQTWCDLIKQKCEMKWRLQWFLRDPAKCGKTWKKNIEIFLWSLFLKCDIFTRLFEGFSLNISCLIHYGIRRGLVCVTSLSSGFRPVFAQLRRWWMLSPVSHLDHCNRVV